MRRFKIKGIAALLTLVILIGQCFVGGALATSPPSYHSSASVEELLDWIRNAEAGDNDAWGSMDSFINAAREQKNILTVSTKNESCVLDEILVTSNYRKMEYFFTVGDSRFDVIIELPDESGDNSLEERVDALNESLAEKYDGFKFAESSVEIDGKEVTIYYANGGDYFNKKTGENDRLAPQAMFEMFGYLVKLWGIADLYGSDWDNSYFDQLSFEFGTERVDLSVKAGPRFSAEYTWMNPFSDVADTEWYYGDVEYVYLNGVMNGTTMTGTVFEPNGKLTRAMMVTVLHRMAGSPDVEMSGDGRNCPFTDVNKSHVWCKDAIEWAYVNGIVNGTTVTTFEPDLPITRQDLAVILHRYIKNVLNANISYYSETEQFVDEALISDYAKTPVKELKNIGIIRGKDGNVYDPMGHTTRAEAAALLRRVGAGGYDHDSSMLEELGVRIDMTAYINDLTYYGGGYEEVLTVALHFDKNTYKASDFKVSATVTDVNDTFILPLSADEQSHVIYYRYDTFSMPMRFEEGTKIWACVTVTYGDETAVYFFCPRISYVW